MRKMLKCLMTGKDNCSYDIGRFLWATSMIAYIGILFYAIYKNQPFTASDIGIGFSTILAGGGLGVAVKGKTEPEGSLDV